VTQKSSDNHDDDMQTEQLMAAYGTTLLRMCCLYLRDFHLAEDAVQETFIKAGKRLYQFRGESSIQTRLVRIAMNTCRDINRSVWYRLVDRRVTPETLCIPTAEPVDQDDSVILAVAALPAKYKEVILLRYYNDLKLSEIAEVLSVSVQTVSSRLRRAKKKLHAKLERWYFDEA